MYKLIYYQKKPDGTLFNGTIVPGFGSAPSGVCYAAKKRLSNSTHRLGVLKVEKI